MPASGAAVLPNAPPPWSASKRAAAWAGLLALYLGLAFYRISAVPLIDPDEPRYAAAGRSMAEGGSWLLPEFNGAPRLNKPPLFYWLVGLSDLACGGASEFSARLPSVVMGLLMLALTAGLGLRMYGERTAFLAGAVLCSSPLFMVLSRWCVIDQTFSTLLAAALACLLLAITGRWPWIKKGWPAGPILAAGVCSGLAFMAKGPATLIVVLVPIFFGALFASPACLARVPWRHVAAAVVVALALPVWWYLGVLGYEEVLRLYRFEVEGRLAGDVHREPFYFYSYVFPGLFFPWSIGLLAVLGCACRRVTARLPLEPGPTGAASPKEVRVVADGFLVAWVAGVILFFTFPSSKLGTYVLPAFPAAALLTARFLLRLGSSKETVQPAWIWICGVCAVLAAAALAGLGLRKMSLPPEIRAFFEDLPISRAGLAIILAAWSGLPWVLGLRLRRTSVAALPLLLLMPLLIAVLLPLGQSALDRKSHKVLCAQIRERAESARYVYRAGSAEESLVYYLHRPIPEVRGAARIEEALRSAPPGEVLLFVHQKYFFHMLHGHAPPGARVLAEGNHLVVLINEP